MNRNTYIYLLIAVAALFLASRLITLALVLAYAPGDEGAYFYLRQVGLALVSIVLIVWLWSKRTTPDTE